MRGIYENQRKSKKHLAEWEGFKKIVYVIGGHPHIGVGHKLTDEEIILQKQKGTNKMPLIWVLAITMSIMLNACIFSNKQFTITDKKTGTSITLTEDQVDLKINTTFENKDTIIEAKEIQEIK